MYCLYYRHRYLRYFYIHKKGILLKAIQSPKFADTQSERNSLCIACILQHHVQMFFDQISYESLILIIIELIIELILFLLVSFVRIFSMPFFFLLSHCTAVHS